MVKKFGVLLCFVASAMIVVVSASSCSKDGGEPNDPGYYKGPMKPKATAGDAAGGGQPSGTL